MKTSRISLNQFLTLLVLFLSSSASLVNVGRFSGRDVWIVILISTVFGGLLFTIYYRISNGYIIYKMCCYNTPSLS